MQRSIDQLWMKAMTMDPIHLEERMKVELSNFWKKQDEMLCPSTYYI